MIHDCLSIIFTYLDWTCDQIYLRFVQKERYEYIKNIWRKNTLFNVVEVDKHEMVYLVNNKKHRDDDLPTSTCNHGSKQWWKNGRLHRSGDKPAIIWPNEKQWFKNGRLHRSGDKPAIEWTNGDREWWKNGKLHRDNNLPARVAQKWCQT